MKPQAGTHPVADQNRRSNCPTKRLHHRSSSHKTCGFADFLRIGWACDANDLLQIGTERGIPMPAWDFAVVFKTRHHTLTCWKELEPIDKRIDDQPPTSIDTSRQKSSNKKRLITKQLFRSLEVQKRKNPERRRQCSVFEGLWVSKLLLVFQNGAYRGSCCDSASNCSARKILNAFEKQQRGL